MDKFKTAMAKEGGQALIGDQSGLKPQSQEALEPGTVQRLIDLDSLMKGYFKDQIQVKLGLLGQVEADQSKKATTTVEVLPLLSDAQVKAELDPMVPILSQKMDALAWLV